MTDSTMITSAGRIQQQEIHSRCFHPLGDRVELSEHEINRSIPERFERQVEQHADRIAFTDETHTLTYRELNLISNRITNTIAADGANGNEPVIALMDKGVSRVCTFWGVLKSGKCYVGISPELPFDRQQFIIEQSEAEMILVHSKYRETGLSLAGKHLKIIDIDEDIIGAADDNPSISIQPDQRCWLVYTSGSTGQPKGVTQAHQNMLHDMRTYVDSFHLSPQDRLSTVRAMTTSGGGFGALMALGNGATLCRIGVQGLGVEHMASEIARHKLTVWGGVSSLFRQWMNAGLPEYPHLRLMWFGGEAVHVRDFELYRKHLNPSCIFVNRLGSTETGCWRMYFADHKTSISGSTVPVGYQVRGHDIILEDEDGSIVEVPGSGEVVLSSSYLSPGYWNRPDLTQSAYRSLEDEANTRLFYTDDMVKMDADGCLTYLGRKDFQVQVRGSRIEVTEVETVLDQLDAIREVVVTGEPLHEGGKELVAYVVPAQRPAPTISVLRLALAESLPDYMIPSRFVYLAHLPRAGNGKILRGQLTEQSHLDAPLAAPWRAPRTSLENRIAEFWEEVLELGSGKSTGEVKDGRHVRVHDDFFDLGGHSLRATQVVARIQKYLSVEVPLRTMFELTTVAEQAKEVERLAAESDSNSNTP